MGHLHGPASSHGALAPCAKFFGLLGYFLELHIPGQWGCLKHIEGAEGQDGCWQPGLSAPLRGCTQCQAVELKQGMAAGPGGCCQPGYAMRSPRSWGRLWEKQLK